MGNYSGILFPAQKVGALYMCLSCEIHLSAFARQKFQHLAAKNACRDQYQLALEVGNHIDETKRQFGAQQDSLLELL